ncbi:alcohol sorbitol dehydrogenase [Fusarium denticulatum]|uniref:Alcohol sorbitol dehydrogenase n=1 Tax=Fusarium denticulatum TaxID=48507 RepID=A0A8H5XEV8_9HYPO|nr:alcohol sorbitol dehydrogenase [Fusarium denticulatum]
MADTVQAVVYHGKGDIRIEQVNVPKPGPKDVQLKPVFVGICGTDLHEYLEGAFLIPTTPHPLTGKSAPVIIGHEYSGVVSDVGNEVDDSSLETELPVCRPIVYSGDTPLTVQALIEPLAVAWNAVKQSDFKPGDTALILGAGPIGLDVLQVLKSKGEECKKLCGGEGVQVVFDCAGMQSTLENALAASRPRAVIVNVALWSTEVTISPNYFMLNERTFKGAATYTASVFQEVLDALARGDLKPEPMITSLIEMEDIEEKGLKALINHKDRQVYIVTGGNAGIGFNTVLELAARKAKVYMGARSEAKANAAISRDQKPT